MIRFRKWMLFFIAVSFVLVPFSTASAQVYGPEHNAGAMIYDFTIVRPLGIASLAIGTASFVVSLPFSILGDNVPEAYHRFMVEPARYTFLRPLGGF